MAESIGAIKAQLELETTQFKTDLSAARTAVKNTGDNMAKSMSKARGAFNMTAKAVVLLAAGATAATGKLALMVKKQIDAADAASKTAQKVGMTTEEFTALNHAADLSGLSTEQFATAMKQLNKNIIEADNGAKKQLDTFKALGVEIRKENGELKSAAEIVDDLADAYENLDDGAVKTQASMTLMGKSGTDMIPMLNGGSKAIKEMKEEARQLGLVIDTQTGRAAEQFNDNLTRLNKVGVGVANVIMAEMLPSLVGLTDAMVENVKESGNLEERGKALAGVFKAIAKGAVYASSSLKIVGKAIGAVGASLSLIDVKKDFSLGYQMLGANYAHQSGSEAGKEYFNGVMSGVKSKMEVENSIWDAFSDDIKKEMAAREAAITAINKGFENTAEKLKQLGGGGDGDNTKKPPAAPKGKTAAELINDQIAALKLQADTFGMVEKEATLYKMAIDGATEAQLDQADTILTLLALKQQEVDIQAEAKQIYEATRTPLEEYNAQMERLQELLEAGAIHYDTFERAATQAMDTLKSKTEEVKDETEDMFKQLADAIDGWGKQSADAFADFVTGGKADFSDLANSIIKDIIRMLSYQMLFQPLFGSISSGISGGGFGGIASGLLGLFGGGRASGGPVSAGKMYEINETGIPEILNMGNRQFLMMGNQNGEVIANSGGDDIGGQQGQSPVNVRIMNTLDEGVFEDFASSASGEQVILNVITKNSATLRAALGA